MLRVDALQRLPQLLKNLLRLRALVCVVLATLLDDAAQPLVWNELRQAAVERVELGGQADNNLVRRAVVPGALLRQDFERELNGNKALISAPQLTRS